MTDTPFARCIAQYGTFTTPIVSLATTSDGALLAGTLLYPQLYHLMKKAAEGYDTHSCNLVTLIRYLSALLVKFCFSLDGDLLAFAENGGVVYLWSMEKDELLFRFVGCGVADLSYLYCAASV